MKIAFLTTQTLQGSTVIGRVLPLARILAKEHELHVLVHQNTPETPLQTSDTDIRCLQFGRDPFIRTPSGKKRLRGLALVARLKWNAWLAFGQLSKIRPDVVIIVKSLPENVLAAMLYKAFGPKTRFVLDVDDFELTANTLSSSFQRAAVHWAQRQGARMSQSIIAATPFLQDHFELLMPGKKTYMLPTGIDQLTGLPIEPGTGENTLLYTGSVSVASGHRVDLLPRILMEIQKELPDARLVIAGDGDDTKQLQENFMKKGLAGSVHWFGRYSKNDIPGLFSQSSVVIDPIDGNITNRAKSSHRVLTALMFGKPVVTSNIGIRSLLVPAPQQPAFFASSADSADYARKIVALMKHPLSQEAQESLKQHAMRYTWEMLAVEYANIIAE